MKTSHVPANGLCGTHLPRASSTVESTPLAPREDEEQHCKPAAPQMPPEEHAQSPDEIGVRCFAGDVFMRAQEGVFAVQRRLITMRQQNIAVRIFSPDRFLQVKLLDVIDKWNHFTMAHWDLHALASCSAVEPDTLPLDLASPRQALRKACRALAANIDSLRSQLCAYKEKVRRGVDEDWMAAMRCLVLGGTFVGLAGVLTGGTMLALLMIVGVAAAVAGQVGMVSELIRTSCLRLTCAARGRELSQQQLSDIIDHCNHVKSACAPSDTDVPVQ